MLLLCLSAGFLFMEVRTHMAGQRLRISVKFGVQVSDVIHNLQQERDMTAFFLSSHMRKTKADLAQLYNVSRAPHAGLYRRLLPCLSNVCLHLSLSFCSFLPNSAKSLCTPFSHSNRTHSLLLSCTWRAGRPLCALAL